MSLVDSCSSADARPSPTSGGRLTTLEQGGHRFELTQKPHCAISNTSLLLAREDHPDKKNFALEHCQPVPTIGKPLEWRMNDHLSWHN